MSPADRVYLIDSSVYIFRAYYSMPEGFTNPEGEAVNAVYGFAGFLCTVLEQTKARNVALAFDESLSTSFRNEIYPPYKANREPAPVDLKRQFAWCRELAESMGLACFSDSRYEADDVIGTLAHRYRRAGHAITIVSADKDLAQLVTTGDFLWDFSKNRKEDLAAIKERFGVRADQIIDYLAMAGDSVDNIPGIPGVGPKSAVALLNHFDDLESILGRTDEIAFLRLRGAKSLAKKIKDNVEMARLCRQLTEIACDIPAIMESDKISRTPPDMERVGQILDRLGFGAGLRGRIGKLHAHLD